MITKSEKILKDALELLPVERAELAEKLLASFILPPDKAIDTLWAQEAEDRIDAYEKGKIKALSAKRVFNRLDNENR